MRVVLIGCAGICAIVFELFWPEPVTKKFIFNRTNSAPIGLYWVLQEPIAKSNWIVVSAKSEAAKYAYRQGFIGPGWPMIKKVAALYGDEVCRQGMQVFINGSLVALAQKQDKSGRALPEWKGCRILHTQDIFLLNENLSSLDGRYLGVMTVSDVDGVAVPIWTYR
ncbi:S26 family signal peptidase [Hirschia litorea]|uniref:S26 family signal peptidase n=1 Tax=Hirschia litorea TaxID=1199156 RepID=A0ABW2IPW2_9PROT